MTHREHNEQRLARLTELARKVWPSFDGFHVKSGDGKQDGHNHYPSWAEMRASTEKPRNREFWSLLHIEHLWETNETRALDALEAALCVLANEPPRWVEQLLTALRQSAHFCQHDHEGDEYWLGQGRGLAIAADALLEAAKAGTL